MRLKLNWDSFGIATSLACAIHCAILPIIVSTLPLFGVNIIHNPAFEWGMIALAFSVGTYALYHGYKGHHQSFFPIVMFSVGVLFLVLKQIFHDYEVWLLIPAVLFIVSAHYYN